MMLALVSGSLAILVYSVGLVLGYGTWGSLGFEVLFLVLWIAACFVRFRLEFGTWI